MVAPKRLYLALGQSSHKSPEGSDETRPVPLRAPEKFVQGNSAPSSGCSFYAAAHESWGLAFIYGGAPRPARPTTSGFRSVGQRLQWAAWEGFANAREEDGKPPGENSWKLH